MRLSPHGLLGLASGVAFTRKLTALSPDLNPIETVWDLMKDYFQEYYPEVHHSYMKLRRVVQEA